MGLIKGTIVCVLYAMGYIMLLIGLVGIVAFGMIPFLIGDFEYNLKSCMRPIFGALLLISGYCVVKIGALFEEKL